jgi:hypothetical protein
MVEWEVFFKYFNSTRISTQSLDPNAFQILISGSYGDIFPNFALLKEVAKHHSRKVIAVVDEKWSSLLPRFANNDITYITIQNEQAFKQSLMSEGRPYVFMPGWVYPVLPTMHPFLTDLQLEGYITDFEMKKAILHLPRETKFVLPMVSSDRILELKFAIESAGCILGKTCILSFENNSNPAISEKIIEELVNILKGKGIHVALNVASTFNTKNWVPDSLSKLPKLRVPADAPNEFIELAGAHVGSFNGLSLILANFRTKAKVAVVTDCTSPTITIFGRQVQSEWWLNPSRISPQDICSENDYSELTYKTYDSIEFYRNFQQWAEELKTKMQF